jgi:hypothetical protein
VAYKKVVLNEREFEMKALEYSSVSHSETLHETIGVNVSQRRYKVCFLVSVVLLLVVLYNVPSYGSSQEDPVIGSSDSAASPFVLTNSPEEESGSRFTPDSVDSGDKGATKNDIPGTEYNCQGDRFAQETPLRSGQFLCSNNKQFVFGMTAEGSLIKRSVPPDAKYKKNGIFYDKGSSGDYFVLHRDGEVAVYDKDDKIQWKHESRATISWTAKCLKKPEYDCPYLHLHDDGVLVVNWIDGGWNAKGIKEVYDFSGT